LTLFVILRMTLPWLDLDTPFPPISTAWGPQSDAPGLLAAGADLCTRRLLDAYSKGIFPWYSDGQPVLWWSTDPRMVLPVGEFKIRSSFAKVLRKFIRSTGCEIRIDFDFRTVLQRCANAPRQGQSGTWIGNDMQEAYLALHHAGYAHSVETWQDGSLTGGLYCVAIGRAVFGESMFSHATDASKIALAALVALCQNHDVGWIDCQQNTRHLASMGAHEVPRSTFAAVVGDACREAPIAWDWHSHYWRGLGAIRPSIT
jgi:leucyl/phenylalanyl-tRNA--protein transferase